MENFTSRRYFMRNSAIALTGLAVLTPALTSALTSENPYAGYNPYAEETCDLRTGLFNSNTIAVKGTVYKKDGFTPLNNALVEVWHLSPNSTKYRHRGKFLTNDQGNYEFLTDYPNKEEGKNSRIYFKISDSGNTQYTELILASTGGHISSKHWENNKQLGEKLFPKQTQFLNKTTFQFNLSI